MRRVKLPPPACGQHAGLAHEKSAMSHTTPTRARTAAAAQEPAAVAPAAPRAGLLPQPISAEVLAEKYAKGDETTLDDVRRRVARALAAVEPTEQRALWEQKFLDAQRRGFVPAGRILSAAAPRWRPR